MKMENILVTGAGGFIGFHLSNFLADHGYQVTGIDIHFPPPKNGNQYKFNAVEGDFRNKELLEKSIKGKDVIFHLASAHLQISLKESEYWDINVHGLKDLLETAKRNGVQKFVHTSSVGVYGNLKTWPADENTICTPQSIYGVTKLEGEKVVKKFYEETGFPVTIIRPAWVYGEGCPRTLKIYKTIRNRKFLMIGKGENLRHPIYITDMIDAFILAIKNDQAIGKTFLIAGNSAINTKELVNGFCKVFNLPYPSIQIPYSLGRAIAIISEKVFSLIKKEPPISTRSLEFFDTNNAFKIDHAKKILSFSPKFSFEAGLADCKASIEKA